MPKTFILPNDLSRALDSKGLNTRLRKGDVRLDWSQVETFEDSTLSSLLKDLDLARHADGLGLSTVPNPLVEPIMRILEASLTRDEQVTPPDDSQPEVRNKPAIWKPESSEPSPTPSAESEEIAETEPDTEDQPEPSQKILKSLTPVEIRAELENRMRLDLYGPAGGAEEEIPESSVSDRYLVGGLAPTGETLAAEEQDPLSQAGTDQEDGKTDEASAGKPALLPSSLGLTFNVTGEAAGIGVRVQWGRYFRTVSETLTTPAKGDPLRVWKRVPFEAETQLELQAGHLKEWSPDPERPEITVRGLARKQDQDWVVTLFLVNGQKTPKQNKDAAWLFQAELEVAGGEKHPIFHRRPLQLERKDHSPTEESIMQMMYRRVAEFAVGHGVAVHADADPEDPTRALRLKTSTIPRFELSSTTGPSEQEGPRLRDVELDMKRLSELPREMLVRKLRPLAGAYQEWIREHRKEAENESSLKRFRAEAESVLGQCEKALERIQAGVETLNSHPLAPEAFRFMNRAMWQQRIHTKYAESRRRGSRTRLDEVDTPENRSWYPFQLAFVLLTLASVTDLHHPDRSDESAALADLLWFPTGGGKTEAYLGVAAYTMGLRRLQGKLGGRVSEHGLAVLMRYTLRLLTLQQFQRAAALICACESIRLESLEKGENRWGKNPFRIGLWVGMKVTPNTTEQSHEAVQQARGGKFKGRGSIVAGTGSPHQLVSCPWCGTKIEEGRDIEVERFNQGRGRTIIYCGDRLGQCLFSRKNSPGEGLPVLVVDEEIYRNPPSLMIATIDKFAQMPWKGEVQALFGQIEGRCERHGFRSGDLDDASRHPKKGNLPPAKTVDFPLLRPPDLIIQDELHLISGPLGTLSGLYETAIDRLASWQVDGKRVRPKLIASTATIRRAPEQVYALYRRHVQIFPPRGLDIRDNFFSRQRAPTFEKPGRLYLGVCAQGRRLKAALIRTYTVLMSAAQGLLDECGDRADPWMTVIGYFSSIRELGGMRRLLEDDVASRLLKMDRRGLAVRRVFPYNIEELTSRKGSTDIPDILDRLEVRFPRDKNSRPFDAVLATNMVSVGVDVQRLGLMAVCGQPKTTAEYIQATSRVGRRWPGLVVTVYNWARPRDLSHYERFEHYHASLYKHVEALSVTPFAARALDRGLFALLVSLVRLGSQNLSSNGGASRLDREDPLVRDAVETIVERAHSVTQQSKVAKEVRTFLETRLDQWLAEISKAAEEHPLGYRSSSKNKGLLKSPGKEPWGEFTCLNSLRDVEASSCLVLRQDRSLDEVEDYVPKADSDRGEELGDSA